MPKGIDSFLGVDQTSHRRKRFKKLRKKCKTKEEIRALELSLLKPTKARQKYGGPLPGGTDVERRTLKIIFKTDEDMELFGKHFPIAEYLEKNTENITLLMVFLDSLERGTIKYDKKTKEIYRQTKKGKRRKL